MKVILLGPPGSGKGTQAENIQSRLNIPAISTGFILREAIKQGDEIGKLAKSYVDSGQLVPDDIVVSAICERVAQPDCSGGFILDGFPRTISQAEALDESGMELDCVLSIEVSDNEIVRRMTGRRVCPDCGLSYHILHNPPRTEDSCDGCGGQLAVREDDKPETVKVRLKVYHETTECLLGYYQRKGILRSVVSGPSSREELAATTRKVNEALGIK